MRKINCKNRSIRCISVNGELNGRVWINTLACEL